LFHSSVLITQKTFNPFKLVGSWVGLFLSFYVNYSNLGKTIELGFIGEYLDEYGLKTNLIGGFFLGYTLHLIIRSMINTSKNKIADRTERKV